MLMAVALLAAGAALAQQAPPTEKMRHLSIVPGPNTAFGFGDDNMFYQDDRIPIQDLSFFTAEAAAAGELVTNAPYTATAVTERSHVLSDGTRIVNRSSAFMARDSQGRTRREVTLERVGTLQMEPRKMVFINDPTEHTQYVISPEESTKLVKSNAPNIVDLRTRSEVDRMTVGKKIVLAPGVPARGIENPEEAKLITHEDLGTQTIEGVSAEGKRETVTIPAGRIGNDRPIQIVSETWFSPELHTMVMRKHSDPRTGETLFRLTDIRRGEPDAALFKPPAGTKVKTEPLFEMKHVESGSRE
jgi:hypothetical protein